MSSQNPYEDFDEPENGAESTTSPTEDQTTEEFAALLPDDVANDLITLDGEPLTSPIYPPPYNFGHVSEYPDPVHYGRDWRLLLPPDSDPYKEAIENPISADDKQYQQVLKSIVANFPKQD